MCDHAYVRIIVILSINLVVFIIIIQCIWLILSRKFSFSPAGRKLRIWCQASRAGDRVFTEVNWLKLRYILCIMIWHSPCSQKMLYVLSIEWIFVYYYCTITERTKQLNTHTANRSLNKHGLHSKSLLGARRMGGSRQETNLCDRMNKTHCNDNNDDDSSNNNNSNNRISGKKSDVTEGYGFNFLIQHTKMIQCVWLIMSRKFSSSPASRKLRVWRQVNWLKLRYILHIMNLCMCCICIFVYHYCTITERTKQLIFHTANRSLNKHGPHSESLAWRQTRGGFRAGGESSWQDEPDALYMPNITYLNSGNNHKE